MKEYFMFRETSNKGWQIVPNYDILGTTSVNGSY